MSRRADLEAITQRIQQRDQPVPEPEPEPAVEEPDVRQRQTVVLWRSRNRLLRAWRMETALALGRDDVTLQDVLATVADAIVDDPAFARLVRAKLEKGYRTS